jgi:hypothetical protein
MIETIHSLIGVIHLWNEQVLIAAIDRDIFLKKELQSIQKTLSINDEVYGIRKIYTLT